MGSALELKRGHSLFILKDEKDRIFYFESHDSLCHIL